MNRIRELREDRGWSMGELAERVRPPTTASQINKLEKAQRRLTDAWMQRLARAFGCAPQDLFETGPDSLSYQERQLVETFRGLSDVQQEAFLHAAEALVKPGPTRRKD